MGLFLKFVMTSAMEKKGKFIMLLFAILMSATLFIASLGVTDVMMNNYIESYTQVMENKEISIKSKDPTVGIKLDEVNMKGVQDIVPQLEFKGTHRHDLDNSIVTVLGRNTQDIITKDANEKSVLDHFQGATCIISQKVGQELHLKVNDTLQLNVNHQDITVQVAGLFLNEGIFFGDTNEAFQMIVPYDFLAGQSNMPGMYNNIIATGTGPSTQASIDEFNSANENYVARTSFTDQQGMLNAIKEGRIICFALLAVVMLLSAVIISSSFRLIIAERMPVIGTFFSQGATKPNIINVLLLESILFGAIGGVLSFLAGSGITYGAAYFLSPHREYGIFKWPTIPIYYFVLAVLFGILLSVISSLLPILQINKLSIKDVILGAAVENRAGNNTRKLLGSGFLVISLLLFLVQIDGIVSIQCILLIAGILLVLPNLIHVVTAKLYGILKDKVPVLALALNNIRTSKELLGNITLMLIAALSVITITSVGDSIRTVMTDGFNRNNFQIQITVPSEAGNITDTLMKNELNRSDIEQDTLQKLKVFGGQRNGTAFQIAGIDKDKYLSYDGYIDWTKPKNLNIYEAFKNAKVPSVIVSKSMAKALGIQAGDKLPLTVNQTEKELYVTGLVDMKMLYGGYVVLVDNDVLQQQFNYVGTNMINAKATGNDVKLRDSLRKQLGNYNVKVVTYEELERANIAENEKTIAAFSLFSLMALVIASFGVLNNTKISYLNSKKNIALLHAIGLSRQQKNRLLLFQSIFVVLWVMLLLIPCSYAMIFLTKDLLSLIGMLYDIRLNLIYVPLVLGFLLVLIVLSTLPVLLNGKRFSIINEMKYE
ncbi:ABC transporter permease [Paenibacillus sp. P32E]|uniref:ABC transporter permease n=1 Tax=Paenibacillus sp. P32E TaxID=1349434 RepID=UPI0009389456|nr:ABC transporter permease [Paenibacillus sp. P32E]OKP82928.1 hypothetical protein A3848_26815 [Paenibacillus sp. P32E]